MAKELQSDGPKKPKTKIYSPPDIRRVRIEQIIIKGKSDINDALADQLAESIGEVGLLHPPTVFPKRTEDGDLFEQYVCVAGKHRIEGAVRAGWQEIDVIVVERGAKNNQKRKVTEDAHRKHLSDLEQKKLIREWLALRTKKAGQNAQPHDKGHSHASKQFGKSNKSIRRAVEAGKLTGKAETALKEAGLDDSEKVILEVAKTEPDEQVAKVEEIVQRRAREKAGKQQKQRRAELAKLPKKNAPGIADGGDEEVQGDPYDKLMAAWNDSPEFRQAWAEAYQEDRQAFIDDVLLAVEESETED